MRENAHGLIAGARTPWQLFNTVSRGEHEATNCDEETPPAPNISHSILKLPTRMHVRLNIFLHYCILNQGGLNQHILAVHEVKKQYNFTRGNQL